MTPKAETDLSDERLPWAEYLKTALGVLNWSPDSFWNSTQLEFWFAVRGRLEIHRARQGPAAPPARSRLDRRARGELVSLMDRFPDRFVKEETSNGS